MLEQQHEEVCSEKSSGHDMVATHISSHSWGTCPSISQQVFWHGCVRPHSLAEALLAAIEC